MDDEKVDWGKKDDTSQVTTPITYPNARFEKTGVARPDDENVEQAKNWVDNGSRL